MPVIGIDWGDDGPPEMICMTEEAGPVWYLLVDLWDTTLTGWLVPEENHDDGTMRWVLDPTVRSWLDQNDPAHRLDHPAMRLFRIRFGSEAAAVAFRLRFTVLLREATDERIRRFGLTEAV